VGWAALWWLRRRRRGVHCGRRQGRAVLRWLRRRRLGVRCGRRQGWAVLRWLRLLQLAADAGRRNTSGVDVASACGCGSGAAEGGMRTWGHCVGSAVCGELDGHKAKQGVVQGCMAGGAALSRWHSQHWP
jgi:hypothetical protein